MGLSPGTKLGPYEILSVAGAGGMGEVYRAKDTRLERIVAIKVLPEALLRDAGARQRLEQEARAVSSLSHPHICTLYDVGGQQGTAFLVLEYLEGETLADRLKKGALPLDDALRVAIQIADALSAAHRHGIVHRDLKPGNVMLTKAGAKLLDFGLAKGSGPANAGAGLSMPTTPATLTVQGTILGTLQYMAPEQIEGQEADARTDIFAFGAMLYEMLTGKRAFSGASHASLISSIMSSQPPAVSAVQMLAPAELDHLIARCLAKDPEDRWQSARDVKLQLSWIAVAPSSPVTKGKRSRDRLVPVLAGLALMALSGTIAAILVARRTPATAAEPVQFVLFPPEKASFSADLNAQAVSPDGRQIAFVASGSDGTRLWIRHLDSLNARTLAGTDGAQQPFWSPDSRSIGFFAGGKLRKIDVAGGPAQTLADASVPLGGKWNRAGVILFGTAIGSPLFRVSAAGGATIQATSLDQAKGPVVHGAPFFLPDGRHFFFVVATGPSTGNVYVGSLDSGDVKLLLPGVAPALYSPPGYVLFLRESTLMAQRFDLPTLSTSGEPVALADGVGKFFTLITFGISDNGTFTSRPIGN
jgi:serine/threonine protein kinase